MSAVGEPPEGAGDPPEGSDVEVDLATALRTNRANWDARATLHAVAYDTEGFIADPGHVSSVVRDDLTILGPHLPGGAVDGLDVLHLQCHIGTDTLSLARLGARVTGLDLSPASLAVARDLAERAGLTATFVEGDATRAADVVPGDFDVVYTSIGVLTWLPDLAAWARSIARLLRPGGTFFVREGHPMLYTLDDARTDDLVVRYRHFATGRAQTWADPSTYAGDGRLPDDVARTYEWPHALSEVVGALLGAGLRLTSFAEQRTVPWRAHPLMEPDGRGGWVLPERLRDAVPLTYSLTAVRD